MPDLMPEHRHEIKNEQDEMEQSNGSEGPKNRVKFPGDASITHSMVRCLCCGDVLNEQCDNRVANVGNDVPSKSGNLSRAGLPRKKRQTRSGCH